MNPFSRLKHYTLTEPDPQARAIEQQENHATECLAACLVFSSKIRSRFVQFMLNDAAEVVDCHAVDIATQETVRGDYTDLGYIDLVLRQRGVFVMAVEVKVRSPENCKHHQSQLLKYKEWLNQQMEEPRRFLFTLVRNADTAFHPERYGANGRRTWWKLYNRLMDTSDDDDFSHVEKSLVKNFCDYLRVEAIVSTYEIKDLLSYAAGLRARQGITSIFNQIRDRLRIEGLETISVEDRKDYWPQLKILRPDWKSIFGDGQNWKIALWFSVPGIWKAKQHAFCPSIELWHEDHGNAWQSVKSKLPEWLQALKSQGFEWKVFSSWRDDGRENTPAEEINVEPKRVVAWRESDSIALNSVELQSEDDLLSSLVTIIRNYADVVGALPSCAR
jgi:hypothetical protein